MRREEIRILVGETATCHGDCGNNTPACAGKYACCLACLPLLLLTWASGLSQALGGRFGALKLLNQCGKEKQAGQVVGVAFELLISTGRN